MINNNQLLIRAKEGDQEAKEELVNNNLGLVHHVVKRFVGRGVEAEELFQQWIKLLKFVMSIENGICFSNIS